MNVIITTNQLVRYGGSEMVALEIAEYFALHGNSVILFTNYYDGKIKADTSTLRYRGKFPTLTISDDWNIVTDPNNVDLLWVQHQLIPPALLRMFGANKRTRPYVIFNHMSSVVKLETPFLGALEPKLADKIFAVSVNTKKAITKLIEIPQKIEIFPNPAPAAFAVKPKKVSKKIKRVAIISNHPPKELLQTATKLRRKKICVDIYGQRHKHVRITPEIIRKYDVVITIGKTVQYCLCMGIPAYVYDHFGGPGYLNKNNIHIASVRNFCGKDGVQKSAAMIVDEIVNGYKHSHSFQRKNLAKFQKIYSLDSRLKKLTYLKAKIKKVTKKDIQEAEKTLSRIRAQHLIAEKRLVKIQSNKFTRHRTHPIRIKFPIFTNISNYLNSFLPQP